MRLFLFLQYPLFNQAGLLLDQPLLRLVSLLLVAVGVALVGWRQRRTSLLVGAAVCLASLPLLQLLGLMGWIYLLLPLAVLTALLAVFGLTLRPGREPLVTAIGEQARGPLSGEMRRYTRRVTWLWVWVFVILLGGTVFSLLVQPLAGVPRSWPFWLLNVIAPGLVAIVFVGEFALRKRLFPTHAHPSFAEYLAIVRRGA